MKKMRKLLALGMVCIMAFALTACGSSGSSGNTSSGEILTIGLSYPTANNEFWVDAVDYFEECAAELGFEVLVDDCNNDQSEQVTDVESMISSGIDALVLCPQDASVCAGITASCKGAGIPVVITDRWPGDDLDPGDDYVCFIGPDDEQAGYNQAITLIESGCTQLVALGGFQSTSVAESRRDGLNKALDEHPEVTLQQFEYAGESMDDGDEVFRNIYQAHSDIDGVWCYNDSLGLAAVNVLKEEGILDSVNVGGMDLLSPAVESMEAGEMYCSEGGHYYEAAFGAVVAFDVASGCEYTGKDNVQLELLSVSRDNLEQYEAKYKGSEAPIVWTDLSKTTNPDADYDFKLTID